MKFATAQGAKGIAELRAIPAAQLLEAAGKQGTPRFTATIDGWFFPESPRAIFAAGKQAHVPLLAGWNSEESNARGVLGRDDPTRENFEKAVTRQMLSIAAFGTRLVIRRMKMWRSRKNSGPRWMMYEAKR